MAQTSCQLASGYPGRGVTFPGCHTTVTTHWTDRHPPPPPSPLGISTTSCGCLPMARSNEGMPKPPVCTDDRGQEQDHREIAFKRLEPCSSSPAVASRITMQPSFVLPVGVYVCWPMRAAGSRQLQHCYSPRTERPALSSFTNSIRRHRETNEYTTRSTLHHSGPDRYAQAHNNGKAAPASVSPPMAVHYTVIYGPDVCLTLFDAMQMSPGRGLKTAPTTSWDRWDNFAVVFCTKLQPKTCCSVFPKARMSRL